MHKEVSFEGYKSEISYLADFQENLEKIITTVSMGTSLNFHNSGYI